MMTRLLSVLAPAFLGAAPALASEGGGGHEAVSVIPTFSQGIVSGVATLVVFGVTFGILAVKVWPKMMKGLDDRAEKIRAEIESAEMARSQAKDALEQYQKRLQAVHAESKKMLDEARQQQAALAAELRAKADAELTELRDRAARDIETAKRAAIEEIYAEASNLATAMASKILRREVKSEDHRTLVEESLHQLQTLRR